MLDPNSLSTADLFIPAEIPFQTRKKAGGGAKFDDFEINTLNTLMKNISGNVKKEYSEMIKYVDAADSFKFNFNEDISKLNSILRELLDIYNLDNYKRTVFKYIDNFSPIKDVKQKEDLDKLLVDAVNERNEDIQIITPIDLNYSGLMKYRFKGFGLKGKDYFYNLNIIKTLYSIFERKNIHEFDLEALKRKKIQIIEDDTNSVKDEFPLYKCLYFEILDEKEWKFIESGVWYTVDLKFKKIIDGDVSIYIDNARIHDHKYYEAELLRKNSYVKDGKKKFEKWFNEELTEVLKTEGISECLDARNIQMSG